MLGRRTTKGSRATDDRYKETEEIIIKAQKFILGASYLLQSNRSNARAHRLIHLLVVVPKTKWTNMSC